ncbi:MAG: hypothetical protein J7L51_02255 [Desulfurococcales archaeon]|nr:hypothetical protein [Desulfurococcales archaeon]
MGAPKTTSTITNRYISVYERPLLPLVAVVSVLLCAVAGIESSTIANVATAANTLTDLALAIA